MQRPINKGSNKIYNIANWFGKKYGWFLHGLVDFGDLSSTKSVSQYSGAKSGITASDVSSKERDYKIIYTGMDDDLTKEAVERVKKMEMFGGGDSRGLVENNTTNSGAKYMIFFNDCNDYTATVFEEYKNLWMEDYKLKNEGASDR